jgi:hypothetical protein
MSRILFVVFGMFTMVSIFGIVEDQRVMEDTGWGWIQNQIYIGILFSIVFGILTVYHYWKGYLKPRK